MIIGTGTNACYLERTDAIIKYQGLLTNSGDMVSYVLFKLHDFKPAFVLLQNIFFVAGHVSIHYYAD